LKDGLAWEADKLTAVYHSKTKKEKVMVPQMILDIISTAHSHETFEFANTNRRAEQQIGII